jgi:hypothetical protein
MSRIEEQVIEQIRNRAAKGKEKYGVTLERDDLSILDWLQHLQEELMDATAYIEKLKEEYAEKGTQEG